jgi:GT2 family glycosyltransferase
VPVPRVSIVVPTWRRPDALRVCLDAIASTVAFAHETIVVAVEGDQPTLDLLQSRPVRVLLQSSREGFVKAANLGFRAAQGDYLIQISDDTRLLPHSLANAIRFLEASAHAHIGLAALFHNSALARNIHQQIQLDGEWFYVAHVRGLCYANYGLARRELYERLGYFDERYTMYGADPDFSLKVWHEAKLAVAPCPGALIRHDEPHDDRMRDERAAQQRDNALLFAKWNLDRP